MKYVCYILAGLTVCFGVLLWNPACVILAFHLATLATGALAMWLFLCGRAIASKSAGSPGKDSL